MRQLAPGTRAPWGAAKTERLSTLSEEDHFPVGMAEDASRRLKLQTNLGTKLENWLYTKFLMMKVRLDKQNGTNIKPH